MSESRSAVIDRRGTPGLPPAGQTRFRTSLDGQTIDVDAATPDQAQAMLRQAYPGRTFALQPLAPEPSVDELIEAVHGPGSANIPAPPQPQSEPSVEELVQAVHGPDAALPPGERPRSTFDQELRSIPPLRTAQEIGDATARRGRAPFQPYTGAYGPTGDVPLEESVNPVEMAIMGTGVGMGALAGAARGPVTSAMSAGVGGLIANRVNKALEFTPGSPTGPVDASDVIATVTPMAFQAGQQMIPPIARRLPGAPAVMHEEAAGMLQEIPGRIRPPTPATDLYATWRTGADPTIPAPNLWLRSGELLRQEQRLQPSFQNNRIMQTAGDLVALARQYRGNVPLSALYEHQQRLGLLVREADNMAWPQAQGLRRLYGALHRDIDMAAASGNAEAQALQGAMQAARREFVADDLETLFRPGSPGITTRSDGIPNINGGRLLDRFNQRLASDTVFAGSLTRAEQIEIQDILQGLSRLPRIPAPPGQAIGSGLIATRGGLAYGATYALTGNQAASAAVAGVAASAPQLISRALMTPTGRNFLRGMIAERQPLDAQTLGALSSLVTTGVEGALPGEAPPVR